MKKLTISIFALFLFTGLFAGDKLSFSVKGGLNISNPVLRLKFYPDLSKNTKLGVNIGIYGEYMIDEHIGAQTGLLFSTQGTKYSFTNTQNVTLNFNTLQLPVHFLYKFEIVDNISIGLHAGPYLSYGLSGKQTNVFHLNNQTATDEYNIYSNLASYKYGRFDFGLGLGLQVEYKHYLADIGYDFGIIDQIKDEEKNGGPIRNGTYRARNLYINVGYKF